MKKITLFDYLKALFVKKKLKYTKKCNLYMILKYLSHENDLYEIVYEANKMMGKVSNEIIYNYLFQALPKGYRYIQYIKADKKTSENEKNIKSLMNEYEISEDEAKKSLF